MPSSMTDAVSAIQCRDLDMLENCLDQLGNDDLWIPSVHPSLLEHAVEEKFTIAVELLLSRLPYGPAPTATATQAFICAMRKDLVDIIRLFLEAALQGQIEMSLFDVFSHAVQKEQQDIALQVMQKPEFDVNSEDLWDGNHPLSVVICRRSVSLVECLLKDGAIVDAPNNKGETALVTSCVCQFFDGCRLLLLHGANPNHRSLLSLSPLHACYTFSKDPVQCENIICLLLRAGLNVNRENWIQTSRLPNNVVDAEFFEWLKDLGRNPQSLSTLCFIAIRVHLSTVHRDVSILRFINELPLPLQIKKYIAMSD